MAPLKLDIESAAPGLRQVEPGLWAAAKNARVSYPDHGHDVCFSLEDDSFWFRQRNAILARALDRFSPGGSILDIGGGNGYVAAALNRLGHDVVVLEPGADGVRNARTRGVARVVHATLEEAGFRPGSVPAAAALDVIEHVPDDLAFVRSVRNLLLTDGRFYLTVPALAGLWSAEDVHAGHFRRYSVADVTRLLRTGGFHVEYVTCFFSYLTLPLWVLRTLPSALGFCRENSPRRHQRQHNVRLGIAAKLLDYLGRREETTVASGRRLAIGTSCLAVARK